MLTFPLSAPKWVMAPGIHSNEEFQALLPNFVPFLLQLCLKMSKIMDSLLDFKFIFITSMFYTYGQIGTAAGQLQYHYLIILQICSCNVSTMFCIVFLKKA